MALMARHGAAAVTPCQSALNRPFVAGRQGNSEKSRDVKASAFGVLAPVLNVVTPQVAFNIISVLMVPVYFLMVGWPRAKLTQGIVKSSVLTLGLSALYVAVLCHSFSDGLLSILGDFVKAPSFGIEAIKGGAANLSKPTFTALAWVHLLLLDFVLAREVFLDGLEKGIFTAHSVILCFMFGPTGLVSHYLTGKMQGSPALATTS
ncbi:hypothetical protein BSKO_07868 [Bryopsis sp. KO-2023]|nr:hypothetical protein BSKO_07868 [Bryopsis sp. KO-2023]